MNLLSRIALGLVKLALVIGVAGGLVHLTQTMRDEAVKAHRQGIVSLRLINSALLGNTK